MVFDINDVGLCLIEVVKLRKSFSSIVSTVYMTLVVTFWCLVVLEMILSKELCIIYVSEPCGKRNLLTISEYNNSKGSCLKKKGRIHG